MNRKTYQGDILSLKEHYTTYPESDRAVLSILTGKYPPLERGPKWVKSYDYSNSLPKVLNKYGYKSYMLSTAPLNFHDDRTMMSGLGFDYIFESTKAKKAVILKDGKEDYNRKLLYYADHELLQKALDVISENISNKYLLVLLPQASHSTFQKPPNYTGEDSQESLIKANARWQLGLIKNIFKNLEEKDEIRNTCFIITGDHGLRHPAESSIFNEFDWLSPLTFHVPFILYSPNRLPEATKMATSHIDITPTILEINGLPYGVEKYHGRSVFVNFDRTLFFLGGDYLPVSGFKKNNMFFMENRNLGLILERPSLDFKLYSKEVGIKNMSCSAINRANVSYDLEIIKSYLLNSN